MSTNQAPKDKNSRKRVRFFNVSLKNGIVVSTPSYPGKQAFLGHLIRSLESSKPDFAWIQFLFVRSDYGSALVRLKNSLHRARISIEQPSIDVISGQERDRRELYRDFYRQSEARMKKVNDIASKPIVTLAIQGMWVSDRDAPSATTLPFDHCSDEHDSLAVFQYRDPRMLLELIDRRMVTDISEHFDRYTKSRIEPPSFLVTPEGLQSYLHLPVGELAESLSSLQGEPSKREFSQSKVEDEEVTSVEASEVISSLVRFAKVPRTEKALEEDSTQPLEHLAAATVRTLELVYSGGSTNLLLSAESPEDLRSLVGLLGVVYGGMRLQDAESRPAFLQELPAIIGLGAGRATN